MRIKLLSGWQLCLMGALLLTACKSADQKSTASSTDSVAVPQKAAATGQDTVKSATGLMYIDIKRGIGKIPHTGQEISMNFVGMLTNGKGFDSSVDPLHPYKTQVGVGQLIKGLDEGLLTMAAGGKRRFIIPGDLGYGPQGLEDIPPNATLIFDVDMLDVH